MTHELQPPGRIRELIQKGLEAWTEAGRLIIERTAAGESLAQIAEAEGVAKEILAIFERVGRGMIYPRLLLSVSPGAKALQRCPPSDQEFYTHNPLTLVVERDGLTETLLVNTENLTPAQVSQVFGKGQVRTEAEQKAWLESQKAEAALKRATIADDGLGYTIRGRNVTFQRGTILTADDLIQLLARMR